MTHHDHGPADIDPEQVRNALSFWNAFTQAIKYAVIGTALISAALALAFTDII